MNDGASAALSKAPTVSDPLIGRVICDRFKITGLIARGGMGKVYRAEQAPLGRVCAIKILNPSYGGGQDPEFHKRFFLEASTASKLTHPNTVTIFDYGRTEDDIYYMAMEYLDGRTLHRAIRQAVCMPEERAAHIARQICRALREAHSIGVIHRDLKPANIFLVEHGDEADFVKVLDFGLVKQMTGDGRGEELTQAGLFMGSPKYMAPEQIRGDRVDARTDVYALGVILYEMVAGKVPFDRATSVQVLMAHVHDPLPALRQMNPNVNVSSALEQTIARCMAKSPDDRFVSMDEVIASLKHAANGPAVPVGNGSPNPQSSSGSGPHAVPNPTGSGPTLSSSSHVESGLKPIPAAFVAPAPPSTPAVASLGRGAKRKNRALGWTGLIGLAAAATAGVVLYEVRPPTHADGAGAAAPMGSVAAAAPAPSPPAPRNVDMIVKVRISTDPDGATIKENGVAICSSTPCDVLYADANPDRAHELNVSLAGYRPESKTIKVGDSPILVKLTPE